MRPFMGDGDNPSKGDSVRTASSQTGGTSGITSALKRALDAATDIEDRGRLEDLFLAAAWAIDALGELDLTAYEPAGDAEEGADLSAWEEIAPIVGATIADVNTLLSTVDNRIPLPEEDKDEPGLQRKARGVRGGAGGIGEAQGSEAPRASDGPPDLNDEKEDDPFAGIFAEHAEDEVGERTGPQEDPEANARSAMSAIHAIATVLRMEVASFGQAIRKPQVMADRWNLLDILEAFRGKFRAGIGEMVYAAAGSLAEVDKEDVVPGYRQEMDRSVGLRRALAILAPRVAKENSAAQAAAPGDGYTIRRHVERISKLLDRFLESPAFRAMRAADRKSLTRLRSSLSSEMADPSIWPGDLRKTAEGLDRFLESMSVINHREDLVIHDREALPRFGSILEAAAKAAEEEDDSRARLLFSDAMETGWRLIGRDPELDEVLRRARRVDISELDAEDVELWVEALKEKLAAVPVP